MDLLKSRPEIAKFICEIASKTDFKNYEIEKVETNQKGEGFLGEVFLVTISSHGRTLDFVMKVALSGSVRETIPIRWSFENEASFYGEGLGVLKKFLRKKGVEGLNFLPECLMASLKDESEVIVLENLRLQGFGCFDKTKVLDDDHVKIIFSTYGKFHGYSMALRDQNHEEFSRITNLHNIFEQFTKNGMAKVTNRDSLLAADCLRPGEDDEVIAEYQKYAGQYPSEVFLQLAVEKSDHPVLLHGDCWSNNLMFKYQEGRPSEIRLIDFQLSREGNPVCDLSYCLYSGASKEVLDNLNEYLKIYHQSLAKTLKNLGSDPDRLYPFSALEEDWRRYSRFGMLISLSVIKMKLMEREEMVDFKEDGPEAMEKMADVKYDEEAYRERVRGLLLHLAEIKAL